MTTDSTLASPRRRAGGIAFDIRPFINGQLVQATVDAGLAIVNPATGEALYQAHASSDADVAAAVAAARDCVDGGVLARLDAAARSRILLAMSEHMERERDTLALYET